MPPSRLRESGNAGQCYLASKVEHVCIPLWPPYFRARCILRCHPPACGRVGPEARGGFRRRGEFEIFVFALRLIPSHPLRAVGPTLPQAGEWQCWTTLTSSQSPNSPSLLQSSLLPASLLQASRRQFAFIRVALGGRGV